MHVHDTTPGYPCRIGPRGTRQVSELYARLLQKGPPSGSVGPRGQQRVTYLLSNVTDVFEAATVVDAAQTLIDIRRCSIFESAKQ